MTLASSISARRLLGAALLSLLACATACDDPITGNVERQGLPGLDFNLDPAASRGAATGIAKASYNVSVDVTTPMGLLFVPNATTGASSRYAATCPGLGALCYNFAPTVRDSTRDPRKPFLKTLTTAFTVNFCDIGGPEHFGATAAVQSYEVFCRFTGAPGAGTVYSLSLVRYMTLVRGENDWVEKARTGTVTDPDTLIVMNSSPGGAPAVDYNWTSNLACNFLQAPAGANPFYLGNTTTAAATPTRINFDKCFSSSGIFYRDATRTVPDSAPVFRNSLGGSNIEQQYNYLEVREGPAPGGRPVARIQIGADIIYNGGISRVQMAVLPLEPLAGSAAYKIVLVDRAAGTATPINARYRTIKTDTTGRTAEGAYIIKVDTSAATVVQSIKGGAANVTHLIEVEPALNQGVIITNYTDLALQPPSATTGVPIWVQFVLEKGATPTQTRFQDVAAVQFGTLPLKPNATPYVYRAAGSASGTNRGDQLGIAFSRLPRPPIGFYYNVWLLSADASAAPVSAGPLRSPLPELASLETADTASVGGIFTPTQILDSNLLLRPADVRALPGPLSGYTRVRLTLEAKDGVPEMSSVLVLEGPLVTPSAGTR